MDCGLNHKFTTFITRFHINKSKIFEGGFTRINNKLKNLLKFLGHRKNCPGEKNLKYEQFFKKQQNMHEY